MSNDTNRVLITSFGIISSMGTDAFTIADNFKRQKTNFSISLSDPEIPVCGIDSFDIKAYTGRFKNIRYLNRGAQFSVASAISAIKNAGLEESAIKKMGLFVGAGPNLDIDNDFESIRTSQALWMLKFLPNTASSIIAQMSEIHGETSTICTACAASTHAIGEAFRRIKHGYLDLALAGGGDSRLSNGGLEAYKQAQTLFLKKDAKTRYVPFSVERFGFVPGEGGAFILLESEKHAVKRNAKVFGEINGFGVSSDASSMTAPSPDGKWAQKAVENSFDEANISASDIDLVSAHGTGTELNDLMEAQIIERVYGKNRPLIIAIKSWIGHLSSACGVSELVLALIAFKEGFVPHIRNLEKSIDPNLEFVSKPKFFKPNLMSLQNFGFGGQNAALVVKIA